ncbi:general secretion pathway protein L [Sphingobium fontiphilum]|uniref:General secretion pathway protein L n=2 Tax=Sphingobium fontiphilum TaxID=944425 RepID=A0A7W6DI96_9SPHN|nr:type II secretion system protein GspL [Sphingobium fontiphilum]MBB3981090.1 general secretion pathway protein L [Sphingobium fontiphilum]
MVREGFVVALPEAADGQPRWMRVVGDAVVQSGEGTNWLSACGLAALPEGCVVMLTPPAALTPLHFIVYPDLAARQGRAAARLAAVSDAIVPAERLFAVDNGNNDPARPHVVASLTRADMVHWLAWCAQHGLDPDLIVPAPLFLPEPETGFTRGMVAGAAVLRGTDMAAPGDMAALLLPADALVRDISDAIVEDAMVAALAAPPINLRSSEFAKQRQRTIDNRALRRMALWTGLILLASLLIALIGIARYRMEAARLDRDSLALAQQVLPQATDLIAAQAEIEARLAVRGAGGSTFSAPLSGLINAMQGAPGVAVTALSRDPDGLLRVTLAAARAQDINIVLVALQSAGFTITATSSQDPGGRTLADITVKA